MCKTLVDVIYNPGNDSPGDNCTKPTSRMPRKKNHHLYLPYLHNTKIDLQWLWLEGEETQEATGLMGEPPCLH